MKGLSRKHGEMDSMSMDYLFLVYNIYTGKTNYVDLPEMLWQDFRKFSICQKSNEISSSRFWALTLQQIYTERCGLVPLMSDPPEVYYTFKFIKTYHLPKHFSFGPIRLLPQHMLNSQYHLHIICPKHFSFVVSIPPTHTNMEYTHNMSPSS